MQSMSHACAADASAMAATLFSLAEPVRCRTASVSGRKAPHIIYGCGVGRC